MTPEPRRGFAVLCIGVTQLIHWGVSYYLIGAFGGRIAAEMGWSSARVYAGYSLALLVMGILSAPVGRWIDRRGGRLPMSLGALLTAASCFGLAACHGFAAYLAVWVGLGAAMRLTLYDAAFAALAKAFGGGARRPIAQITLLGGLASTVFWPFGNWLAEMWTWRVAVTVYGGIALASIPLFWTLPAALPPQPVAPAETAPDSPPPPPESRLAMWLFAFTVGALNFLNSAMSAHMIGLLAGLGMALPVAVWVASFRGIGQSAARLMEILFGGRLHPLNLHLAAALALPVSFAAGGASGLFLTAAMLYSGLYGISNGLMTITRGTLPLVLFDPARYGTTVGRLLTPGFLVAAAAPAAFAAVIDAAGPGAAMTLATALAVSIAVAAVAMRRRFHRPL